MGDVADDMMDEAMDWHDRAQRCERGHTFVDYGWGCYECEMLREEEAERTTDRETDDG